MSDAAALAALHAAAFRRGWSEDEFERLSRRKERNRPSRNGWARKLIGFILSRLAAGEAEILSIAVAASWRGRGLARRLLDLHLRASLDSASRAVFLEVDEDNEAGPPTLRSRRISRGWLGGRLTILATEGRPQRLLCCGAILHDTWNRAYCLSYHIHRAARGQRRNDSD